MAKYTHDAIMRTFTEMLQEMPFDKITVSELVRRCNISPNTFYYHYKDILELLNEWLSEGLERFFARTPEGRPEDWRTMIKRCLRLCKDHSITTYHIYNCLSRDALERFAFRSTTNMIDKKFKELTDSYHLTIPQDKAALLADALKYMFVGFFLKFIWNRMNDDIDQFVDSFIDIVEKFLVAELTSYM